MNLHAVTADFNLPAWNYHGRASGERRGTIATRAANQPLLPEQLQVPCHEG